MAIKIQETVGSTAPQLLGQSQKYLIMLLFLKSIFFIKFCPHICSKKLAELQEVMKNSANAPKTSVDASKGENGSVVYELQYKPHQVQLESACKKVVLYYFQERLNAETGQKSLVDIVQSMHAKLSAWDVSQIDQVV